MKVEHFTIHITQQQCGQPCTGPGAELTAYLLDPMERTAKEKRPCVIICPGGGYEHLSSREDQPPAMEFLAMGCQVFVLHYSLAPNVFPRALLELASAVRLIRSQAQEWQIDPNRIAVCGFSAGGHLACSLGAFWNSPLVWDGLGCSKEEVRPNAMILCYPVITSGEFCHPGSFIRLLGDRFMDPQARALVSLENQVGPHTPKTFLWHTCEDQSVPLENSLLLASALRRCHVPLEMHIYPQGRHGLSLATHEVEGDQGQYYVPACQSWISLLKTWIQQI